jgi:hypothetical protein
MSSIVIQGDTSGSVTLQAPAVSGSTVLNLPATSGTIQASGAGYTTNGVAFASSTSVLATGSALTFDGFSLGLKARTSALFYNTNSDNYARIQGATGSDNQLIFSLNSEGMRLTDTGLGIGTSSPSYKLDVSASSSFYTRVICTSAGTYSGDLYSSYTGGGTLVTMVSSSDGNNGYGILGTITNHNQTFFTNSTEKARIDTNGNFLVGVTSPVNSSTRAGFYNASSINPVVGIQNARNVSGDVVNTWLIGSNCNNTSSYFLQAGVNGVANVLYIYGNGNIQNTNNSYGGISDVKLKENIVDASPKLADLMQVKVRNYNLIGSTTKQIGVVAQELETIFPAMVDESPDRDTENNVLETTTKSVKYSVFVPMLIKAIQEQQALITTLTERITALEGV